MGSGLSCRRRKAVEVVGSEAAAKVTNAAIHARSDEPLSTCLQEHSGAQRSPEPPAAATTAAIAAPTATTPPSTPATATATATDADRVPRHRRVPHIGGLAVSLSFLLRFASRHVPRGMPTWRVVQQLVQPHTQERALRYVDLPDVSAHVLPYDRTDYYFISHAWGRPFWEMVGLVAHYLRGAVASDTFVWCDIFIINQHPGQQQQDDLQQLRLAVRDARATLVCVDEQGSAFERIWCLFEMWTTLTVRDQDPLDPQQQQGVSTRPQTISAEIEVVEDEQEQQAQAARLTVAAGMLGRPVPPCRRTASPSSERRAALVMLSTGLSAAQRARLYAQIDAASAKATVPTDKERILSDIQASLAARRRVGRCHVAAGHGVVTSPHGDCNSGGAGGDDDGDNGTFQGVSGDKGDGISAFNAALRCLLLLRPLDWRGELGRGTEAAAEAGAWDFSLLRRWLALPPTDPHHRALALVGPAGSGKSTAAAAAAAAAAEAIPGGDAEGHVSRAQARPPNKPTASPGSTANPTTLNATPTARPVAVHFCRSSDLATLDPVAALRSLAYQLALLFPERLQRYYAFELVGDGNANGGSCSGRQGVEAVAGVPAGVGEGGAGPGGGGSGSGAEGARDVVASAFEVLLLRPLQLLWEEYEHELKEQQEQEQEQQEGERQQQDQEEGEHVVGAGGGAGGGAAGAGAGPRVGCVQPPRLLLVLDAIDEGGGAEDALAGPGDGGGGDGGAGGQENAMLQLVQEHLDRLPPFVRLLLTCRPHPRVRAVLAAPSLRALTAPPAALRPLPPACITALAARLAARAELRRAFLNESQPLRAVGSRVGDFRDGGAGIVGHAAAAGGRPGSVAGYGKAERAWPQVQPSPEPWSLEVAEVLWKASNGWMLYVQLAVDILARVAGTVTPSAGRPGSGVSRPSSGASGASSSTAANSRLVSSSGVGVGVSVGLPVPVSVSAVLDELLACHTADALYGLYMRHVVGLGPGAERSGGDDGRLLAFLLQVLGAAREPLFLSQLQELLLAGQGAAGGPGTSGPGAMHAAGQVLGQLVARLGVLVSVSGYRLQGLHRSLFEWLGSPSGAGLCAALSPESPASSPAVKSVGGNVGGGSPLSAGHAALAAGCLRDVAEARASRVLTRGSADDSEVAHGSRGLGGGGGSTNGSAGDGGATHGSAGAGDTAARGPRSPEPYTLRHAVNHVGRWAADRAMAGDHAGALQLLRSLLLDLHYWRCVHAEGRAAAGPALASLLALAQHPAWVSGRGKAASGGGGGGGSGALYDAAVLVSDAARWLQSYHRALLRRPEGVLQSALSLPATSPVRAAALAALQPRRGPAAQHQAPPSTPAMDATTNAARGIGTTAVAVNDTPEPTAAMLQGVAWPPAYALANPSGAWEPCALRLASRGTTRGVAWSEQQRLLVTACDDSDVHLLSPVSGAQVGLLQGHTDRVYCLALGAVRQRPQGGRQQQAHYQQQVQQQKQQQERQEQQAHRQSRLLQLQLVASGSLDGSVRLWDLGSGEQLQLLTPGSSPAGTSSALPEAAGSAATAKVSFGYDTELDRPTGQGAGGGGCGSVDCVAFSSVSSIPRQDGAGQDEQQEEGQEQEGTWLAAGCADGSITVWQVHATAERSAGAAPRAAAAATARETHTAHAAPGAAARQPQEMPGQTAGVGGGADVDAVTTAGVTASVRCVLRGHSQAVAGLCFMELPVGQGGAGVGGVGVGSSWGGWYGGVDVGGVGGGSRSSGPGAAQAREGASGTLVLVSCSEDGNINLWEIKTAPGGPNGDSSSGSSCAVHSDPLAVLRLDNPQQQLQPQPHEDTGVLGQQPGVAAAAAEKVAAAGRGGPALALAAAPGLGPDLLSGVAEDADAPQSRYEHRAHEVHCVAAGQGLPPGCLLSGTGSGAIAVWDVRHGGALRERLRGHTAAVTCLALQDGGPHFASGSADCSVRLWRHVPTDDASGWRAALEAAARLAQADSAAAAAPHAADIGRGGGGGGGSSSADPAAGKDEEAEAEGPSESRAPPPRCRRPVQWQAVRVLRGHTALVTGVAFLGRGGERLASSSVDFTTRIWLTGTGAAAGPSGQEEGPPRARAHLPPPPAASPGTSSLAPSAPTAHASSPPPGHWGYDVLAVAVSPDGKLVATGAEDFTACLWDAATGAHQRTLHGGCGAVGALAFSGDSRVLALGGGIGEVRMYGTADGAPLACCRGHTRAVRGLAWSPHGSSLLSASEDGTARVWSSRGFQTASLEGHPRGATAAAWSPDGAIMATGCVQGSPGVILWDARSRRQINTLRYHVSDVVHLAFGGMYEQQQQQQQEQHDSCPGADGDDAGGGVRRRRHVLLLLSYDARGLACVWDVWGGGLLHAVEGVRGAALVGSVLVWLQDDAFTRLDLQHLVDARTAARAAAAKAAAAAQEGRQHEGAGVGGHERQQQQQPDPVELQTLVALAPPSQRMRVFAVGEAGDGASGVSSVEGQQAGTGDGAGGVGGADGVHGRGLVVVAVTDTQELLVFRQPNAHVARGTG